MLGLDGSIAEQRAGNLRSTALDQLRGETTPQKMQLRDILAVLDTAAKDEKIVSAVLILDELDATGLATLREIGAAVDRFRAKGKKVVAWGSSFDQRQYYIAAHADEVYLHPMGAVNVTGFGGVQNYYKDALDKVGVSVKVLRAGSFKDFGEAYVANEPSPEAREAESALLGSLWKTLHRRDREAAQARARLGDEVDRRGAGAAAGGGRRPRQAGARPTRRSTA